MDLTGIFRTFHPKTVDYIVFSSVHGTFSRIDHILAHKTNLNKLKKIEIILCILSDHNVMKLEVNHKKKSRKSTNKLLLNNEWVNQEIKEEIKKSMETNENENTKIQNLSVVAKVVLRGKFTAIPQYLLATLRSKKNLK